MSQQVIIVDIGTGNLHSVRKAFEFVAPKASIRITRDCDMIEKADRLVLPGQGAIGTWFEALSQNGLKSVIESVLKQVPVLGICLGLQSLYEFSEEDGGIDGLGLLSGSVRRFSHRDETGSRLAVPHMGWNNVRQSQNHPLWRDVPDNARFYFVHSYFADPGNEDQVAGETSHGVPFASAATRDNLFAVQFHPEKSQRQGLKILENFMRWDG